MATLRFRARGVALVQDHEALVQGVRRYIGRRFVEAVPAQGDTPAQYGFAPTGELAERSDTSPFASLYLRDVAVGALWPGDEETAKRAEALRQSHPELAAYPAVVFDPTYGGTEPAKPAESAAKKGA